MPCLHLVAITSLINTQLPGVAQQLYNEDSSALYSSASPATAWQHPALNPPRKNIVQLAQSVPDLSTLVTALVAGKLTGALSGAGPFTVFAPTNEAFAKVPAATLAHLLDPANIKELDAVLEYHVIAGAAVFAKDLKPFQMVKTLEGEDVKIVKAGRVVVNNATVTAADNAATNGVVHIIDGVLLPPMTPTPAPTGNCTKDGCRFSALNKDSSGRIRCGEVDAAPRMPGDIWNDPEAVAKYVDLTLTFYHPPGGPRRNQPCNRTWSKRGVTTVPWTDPKPMSAACDGRCNCVYSKGTCKDVPDDPKEHHYCSLCGPKFNAPIRLEYWFPFPPP